MNIVWHAIDALVAGIPAYLLIAFIFQLFNPDKNCLEVFKIKQLLNVRVSGTDIKETFKGNIPEKFGIPLLVVVIVLLLGGISYAAIDAVLDKVPAKPINNMCLTISGVTNVYKNEECLDPMDSQAINRVYTKEQYKDWVLESNYESSTFKTKIENFYKNDNKNIKFSETIYEYQKEALRSKGKFYSSSCGMLRALVRGIRQMMAYSIILAFAFVIRFLYSVILAFAFVIRFLYSVGLLFIKKCKPNKDKEKSAMKYSRPDKRLSEGIAFNSWILIGFFVSAIFVNSFYLLWGVVNDNYYEKVIITYHIEHPINKEK